MESLQVEDKYLIFFLQKFFHQFSLSFSAKCGQVVWEEPYQTDLHGRASADSIDLEWPQWRGGQQPHRGGHQGGAGGGRPQHDRRHSRLHRAQHDRSWIKTIQSASARTSEAVLLVLLRLWSPGSQHRLGHGKYKIEIKIFFIKSFKDYFVDFVNILHLIIDWQIVLWNLMVICKKILNISK